MNRITYIVRIVFVFIVLGFSSADAQERIAEQAYQIFQAHCMTCHGDQGTHKEILLIDRASLIKSGTVVPGDPQGSAFYRRITENTVLKPQMPLGTPPLSAAAIDTVERWILAGAPEWDVSRNVNFITPEAMLKQLSAHLSTLPEFDRPFARYFTMTHLYNAGESPETLHLYRTALSKLVNSLSWGSEVINPQPIDALETLFYIDLRKYEWDIRGDAWGQIETVYPYTIEYAAESDPVLFLYLTSLREGTDSNVPFVHVDWFLATAALPPLYHDILDLPATDSLLETALDVNVERNLQTAPGVRVLRAGFNDSGVSNHNRVVERHRSRYGAYWKSYDFAGSAGKQNVYTHPLSFQPDGGEIVFHLPNRLQAYLIVDADGQRIDVAPTSIVSNPQASDPAVHNGLSCIGCHTEGMKPFTDTVRAAIDSEKNPAYDKEQALRLYVEKTVMDPWVEKDAAQFREALEATGAVFGGLVEPVSFAHEAYIGPVSASHAAAAVGVETEVFLTEIREKSSLQSLGLLVLDAEGGNVKRDAWTANFAQVIVALNSSDDIVTRPDPDPDLPPDGLVSIPDPNLRAAVEAALGKAPGAVITAADMAKLERIEADERGISDLRGLEAATHLERIEFRRNSIADLSPLRGLTRLNNIKLRGNRITDVSPLAGLINVDWLGLEENTITDLSPLKDLVKLNGIGISENPISDVSPLANLISLEGIDAWRTPISDFSSLAKLPRLRWIGFGDDRSISALPSLKGLKSLRRLEINDCNISDLSELAELTQLEWLGLVNNQISDISPLANLKDLEHLNLDANVISDVSPLAKLTQLKVLYLENNQISDVSPLAGLTNLERLDLRNNAISNFSPLEALVENTLIKSTNNPGVLRQGGPKIKGPWLWVQFPGLSFDDFRSNKDLLAGASGGDVTELEIATNGATEGQSVGDKAWTSGKIKSDSWNNIEEILGARGDVSNIVYGSITLDSPREQKTTMFAGSADDHKVWLNGQLINEHYGWSTDYQVFFPATLKRGKNVLLISVYKWDGRLGGHFGFAPDAEYTLLPPGAGFSLSAAETQVQVADTFTVQLKAENISDLAGWQGDITFDPAVLKVNNVQEGSFLKQGGGRTHFLKGTIDNTEGRIADIGSARLSEGGANGEGTLLSVSFTAKANGESRLSFRKFQAGSSSGKTISARAPDIIITIGEPSISVVGDTKFFSLATDPTPVRLGETFRLNFTAEDVIDLAGWQVDIAFDADVLEAVEVNEGDFLKSGGGAAFFLQGSIDNTAGEITKISSARTSGGGVTGTGTLLSVTFMPKTTGETQITLNNFFAGASSGETISSDAPEIVITIEERAYPAWDVNADGTTNVLDLILVAQHLGEDASANPQSDVNGDGTINVLDLIVVAQHLGEPANAAAPFYVTGIETLELDPAAIQMWIAQARVENDGSLAFQQGIENLQQLLAVLLPEKTALLPNYPNPFNPETWIPYDLAEAADVTVRIYAAGGVLVRTLALGHQAAGIYQSRTRAAYWDGKNEVGEPVASGVYFYMLTAGDFTGTRKMLIVK